MASSDTEVQVTLTFKLGSNAPKNVIEKISTSLESIGCVEKKHTEQRKKF
jgi:ribosomal protein S19E (S16A)